MKNDKSPIDEVIAGLKIQMVAMDVEIAYLEGAQLAGVSDQNLQETQAKLAEFKQIKEAVSKKLLIANGMK